MKRLLVILLVLMTIGCSSSEEKVYYPDGSLSEIRSYKDGVRHGNWILFHENGDTSRVYVYKEDSLKSMRILVNNNTALYREYKDSIIQHGKEIFYHSNGQEKTISHFENGVPHGKTLGFYSNGANRSDINYEYGKMKELKQFYPNGNLFISSEDYNSGIVTYHDSTGAKKLDLLMKNGKSVDTLKVY